MAIRGVSLETEQTRSCLLKSLLSPINIEDYYWYRPIDQEEVWARPNGNVFFQKNTYSGPELGELINSDHFIVFLRLEAYKNLEEISFFDSFEQFSKSLCQIVLLISDCEYIEFYFKDEKLARKVYKSHINEFQNVKYITDENDTRTGMKLL